MEARKRRSFWRGPWPWALAAIVVAGFAMMSIEREPEFTGDPRPFGGAEDIEALAARDDVNLLFILVDTLRKGHLRTYGYARPTSPLFDTLAMTGLRFDRHMAASSWTKCSMAALWTAMNPARAGVTRFDDVIPDQARLPAEIFREAGFRTTGLWRNGWVEGYFGFDQGFEVYARPGHRPVPDHIRQKNPTVRFGGTDLDLVDTAQEFLLAHGHERWFLYLHMMDVHEYTYGVESARFGSGYADAYDNSILHVNRVIDLLLGQLTLSGLLEKTVIVITSDHGEAFGERQSEGHARDVYPETTEVPLYVTFPFRLRASAVVEQRTASVDVWPTLLDLLGLPPMEDVDGRSRLPEILAAVRRAPAPADDAVAIAHLDQTWGRREEGAAPNVAVTRGRFRYVSFQDVEGETTREELFDAERDPRELENLLEQEPEAADELRAVARAYLAEKPPWEDDGERLELDEMQLNQLRALGYQIP